MAKPIQIIASPFFPTGQSWKCGADLSLHCGRRANQNMTQMYVALNTSCHRYLHQVAPSLTPPPSHITEYQRCMNLYAEEVDVCQRVATRACLSTTIRSAKVIRASLQTLDAYLASNPNAHLVYYTRDPRGIINSRMHLENNYPMFSDLGHRDIVRETKLTCNIMLNDFFWYKKLRLKYPGAIHYLRYEDLAAQPLQKATEVYQFLNRTFPLGVRDWIIQSRKGSKNPFSTSRTNSTLTASKWKKDLHENLKRDMTTVCTKVLKLLGYNLEY